MGDVSGQKIVEFANARKRTKVGSGECYDLADAALRDGGAKTAADYGAVTADADYEWGAEVALGSVQPGDVLQYRDYVLKRNTQTNTSVSFPDGSTLEFSESETRELSRPHHTAIVQSAPVRDVVGVLEQNVDRGRGIMERLVDVGEIVLKSQPASTTSGKRQILVDLAWGEKMKKLQKSPGDRKLIDTIVRKNLGKMAGADVEATVTVTVAGTLKAYRPQPK